MGLCGYGWVNILTLEPSKGYELHVLFHRMAYLSRFHCNHFDIAILLCFQNPDSEPNTTEPSNNVNSTPTSKKEKKVIENGESKDYSSYPPLHSPPSAGQVIAYKVNHTFYSSSFCIRMYGM